MAKHLSSFAEKRKGLLTRLAQDRSGNTSAMVAAAIAPLLAMVGGGIDVGRNYLAQSRLQQACDAGVLAARKKLGSGLLATGIPAEVVDAGNRLFTINYREGSFGTEKVGFEMALEDDTSISGLATVVVPTTVMRIFGEEEVEVNVECEAQLNFSNTDIMMVLDTTGSMLDTNPSDTEDRITILRKTVRGFYDQIESSNTAGTRIRYGFVPYSSNVNVGDSLRSEWFADSHGYRTREGIDTGKTIDTTEVESKYDFISGEENYTNLGVVTSCPVSTVTYTTLEDEVKDAGLPTEERRYKTLKNGKAYSCNIKDGIMTAYVYDYIDFIYETRYKNKTVTVPVYEWVYDRFMIDVSKLKNADPKKPPTGGPIGRKIGAVRNSSGPEEVNAWYRGCIEETRTAEVTDYANIPATAYDLNIDHVPNPADPETLWAPTLYEIIHIPQLSSMTDDNFVRDTTPTENYYTRPSWDMAFCPTKARPLAEMTTTELDSYLVSLNPGGSTYHDIGMLWGGRFLSPEGIFAVENANLGSLVTSRHLIFLTDGITAPERATYGTYGVEPLDQRRCTTCTKAELTTIVEDRFKYLCQQVKNKNVTVWVIGFGTELTEPMKECAGTSRWFEASKKAELDNAFTDIARSIGDLRLAK